MRLEQFKNLVSDEDYVEVVRERELGNQVWFGNNMRHDFDWEKRGKMRVTGITMYTLENADGGEDPVLLIYVQSSAGIKELSQKSQSL